MTVKRSSRRSFLAAVPAVAALGVTAGFVGKCKVEEESTAIQTIPWPSGIPAAGEWKDPRPAAPGPSDPLAKRYGIQLLVSARTDAMRQFLDGLWLRFPEKTHLSQYGTPDGLMTKVTIAWSPSLTYEQVWQKFISDTLRKAVFDSFGWIPAPIPAIALRDGVEFDLPIQLQDASYAAGSPFYDPTHYGPIGVWDPTKRAHDWDENPYVHEGITPEMDRAAGSFVHLVRGGYV